MKIILREDVPHLGKAGELATVRAGYGRNFLIPYGKAVLASEKNVRQLEHQKRVIQQQQAKLRASSEAVAFKLRSLEVTIARKVGEQDKLFGSVTNKDVAEELSKLGANVERQQIELEEPIKTLGEFELPVKLPGGVTGAVKLKVVAEA